MGRVNNCILLTCDRCFERRTYISDGDAEIEGWELEFKLPDKEPLYLCPKCIEKWNKLVHDFLYSQITEETK